MFRRPAARAEFSAFSSIGEIHSQREPIRTDYLRQLNRQIAEAATDIQTVLATGWGGLFDQPPGKGARSALIASLWEK